MIRFPSTQRSGVDIAHVAQPEGPRLLARQRRGRSDQRFRQGLVTRAQSHLLATRTDGGRTFRPRPARRHVSVHHRQSKSRRGNKSQLSISICARRLAALPASSVVFTQVTTASLTSPQPARSKTIYRLFIYTPKNATFYGGEGRVDFHLLPLSITKISEPSDSKSVKNVITGGEQIVGKNPNDLFLRLQADYVHAEDSNGEPLPRITPFRWGVSLNYDSEHWVAKHRRLS